MSSKHPTQLSNVSLSDLAIELSNLQYDVLAEFLKKLSEKIYNDAQKDLSKSRIQLSTILFNAAILILSSSERIQSAWKICEPHLKINREE